MDAHRLATSKDQDHGLQQPALVSNLSFNSRRGHSSFSSGSDPQREVGSLDRILGPHPVLERAAVDLHAA